MTSPFDVLFSIGATADERATAQAESAAYVRPQEGVRTQTNKGECMNFEEAKAIVLADIDGSSADALQVKRSAWIAIGQRASDVKAAHPEAKTTALGNLYDLAGLEGVPSQYITDAAWFAEKTAIGANCSFLDGCPFSRASDIRQWDRTAEEREAAAKLAGSRAAWCLRVAEAASARFAELGATLPQVTFAVAPRLPKVKGADAFGLCYSRAINANGEPFNHIAIVGDERLWQDSVEAVHVVVHELIHASDDCASGHTGHFKRVAKALGIQSKGLERTPEAAAWFAELQATAGDHGEGWTKYVAPVKKAPKEPQVRSFMERLMDLVGEAKPELEELQEAAEFLAALSN